MRRNGLSRAFSPFDLIDAGLRVRVASLQVAGVNMTDPRHAALGGVEIEVEHAVGTDELQLGPVAFANLQPGVAEMLDQLIGGHAIQGPMIVAVQRRGIRGGGLWRSRCRRWPGRTGRDGKQDGKDWETHWPLVAKGFAAGKLAAARRRR